MCLRASYYVLKEVSFANVLNNRKMSWNSFCIKFYLHLLRSIHFLQLYCNFIDWALDWSARHRLSDKLISSASFACAQSHWDHEYGWIFKHLQVYFILFHCYSQSARYWPWWSRHCTWNRIDNTKRHMIIARTRAFPLLPFSEVIQTAIMFLLLHLTTFRNIINQVIAFKLYGKQ